MNNFITSQSHVGAAEAHIDYVVRAIQYIKYVKTWTEHDGAINWKSNVTWEQFKTLNKELVARRDAATGPRKDKLKKQVIEKLEAYRRRHEKDIAAYKEFLQIYDRFGPSVFLDRYWDPVYEHRRVRRSKDFSALLAMVCDNFTLDDDGIPFPELNFDICADSLYHILLVFGSEDLATYAENFLESYPPLITEGVLHTWGIM
ncbi:hypothetical protein BDZ89DRAFT_506024 [Hymenopellis radicata]|nr:hypothetical protein BDZ89DRAFT_506024 [Hymenopellis radicata]